MSVRSKPEIRNNGNGSLDEIVARDAYVHLEQMGHNCWWLAIESGGQRVHVWFNARGKITARVEVELVANTKPLTAKCPCGEDTIAGCATRPTRHCGAWETDNRPTAGYAPGSFGCHEALHMASVLHGMVQEHLCDHPAIKEKPEWRALADKASEALFALYQAIGGEHI